MGSIFYQRNGHRPKTNALPWTRKTPSLLAVSDRRHCLKGNDKVIVITWNCTRSPWLFATLRSSNRSLSFSRFQFTGEERTGQCRDDQHEVMCTLVHPQSSHCARASVKKQLGGCRYRKTWEVDPKWWHLLPQLYVNTHVYSELTFKTSQSGFLGPEIHPSKKETAQPAFVYSVSMPQTGHFTRSRGFWAHNSRDW